MKKKMALCLIATTVLSMNAVMVYANENMAIAKIGTFSFAEQRLSLISRADATLSINSSGNSIIGAKVIGVSGVTKISATTVLQKYSNGRWTDVKTFSSSSNSANLSFSNSHTVSKGYTYRVKMTATAYKGTTSEKVETFSSEVSY